jgi:hypothetical protein
VACSEGSAFVITLIGVMVVAALLAHQNNSLSQKRKIWAEPK